MTVTEVAIELAIWIALGVFIIWGIPTFIIWGIDAIRAAGNGK
jgi:hypothetical protein